MCTFTKAELMGASYGTGKGTTARIMKEFFGWNDPVGSSHRAAAYTAAEIGEFLDLPARQLSKRLNEQVKQGNLSKTKYDTERVSRYSFISAGI